MRRYRTPLRECRRLTRSAHTLLASAVDALSSTRRGPDVVVQAMILTQLSNQARLVTLAAERGYPLQALASLATAYELAAYVGFIGERAHRAQQWQSPSDTHNSFPSSRHRRSAIRDLLMAGSVPDSALDAQVAAWEKRYEFYCMAKHGNPAILRRYGHKSDRDRVTLFQGPVGGAGYYELAQVSMIRSSHLLLMAVSVLVRPHLEGLPRETARRLIHHVRRAALQLRDAAACLPQRPGAA